MTAASVKASTRKGGGSTDAAGAINSQPGSNWMPMARAPFYFLPKFSPAGEPWKQQIEALIVRFVQGLSPKCTAPDVVEIRLQHLQLVIDAAEGEFGLGKVADDDFGVRGAASDVLQASLYPEAPDEAETLVALGQSVWGFMEAAFETAVEAGDVRLVARAGSLMADFVPINSDQAKFFEFELERRDETGRHFPATATGPAGEVMFCPYIVPPQSSAPSDVELEMADWLISEKRAHPKTKKEALFEAVRIRWGKTSEPRFKKIWGRARKKTPELPWSKRGPKPK